MAQKKTAKRPAAKPTGPARIPAQRGPARQRILVLSGTGKRRLSWREKG